MLDISPYVFFSSFLLTKRLCNDFTISFNLVCCTSRNFFSFSNIASSLFASLIFLLCQNDVTYEYNELMMVLFEGFRICSEFSLVISNFYSKINYILIQFNEFMNMTRLLDEFSQFWSIFQLCVF